MVRVSDVVSEDVERERVGGVAAGIDSVGGDVAGPYAVGAGAVEH